MCIICIDLDRGALNANEARRALSEMRTTLPEEHVRQVEEKIDDASDDEPTSPHSP
jgi:polyhydroxyalkanoate synthesis regulator phasin